jgi:hypothetical protein
MGTLQHQFNTSLSNFRNFEKARLARTQGGRNLDEEHTPPYEAPKFESLLPPSLAADQAIHIQCPQADHKDRAPKVQNKPVSPSEINHLLSSTRRPAA